MIRQLGPLVAAAFALAPLAAAADPVLLITIDGLRPADAAQMPSLSRLAREGTQASAVTGVWPTLTYPSHTTLVTGASPARHRIGGNEAFDPLGTNGEGWMWYAEDIGADTLWAAARRVGLRTAAINWPVTVGAAIDFNVPQVWRSRSAEDAKLLRAVSTAGLVARLEKRNGIAMPLGSDGDCPADHARARHAASVLALEKPGLTLVHLECLDHVQHDFGPDSPEAKAALASLNAALETLIAKARKARPRLVVAVASDHGFAPVHTAINLHAALREAGLVAADGDGTVRSWDAAVWAMSGSAGIVLRDPGDAAVKARVAALLDRLAADPRLGIAEVLVGDAARRTAGSTRVSYWIAFRGGFASGGYRSGDLVQRAEIKGTHGYAPQTPGMAASFAIAGPGIAPQATLGTIDMRAIAPTLARILGVKLRSSEQPELPLARR